MRHLNGGVKHTPFIASSFWQLSSESAFVLFTDVHLLFEKLAANGCVLRAQNIFYFATTRELMPILDSVFSIAFCNGTMLF